MSRNITDKFESQLKQISDVWNYFILKYRCCSIKLKLNEELKTNYFGDILGYFTDVVGIIFPNRIKNNNHTEKFSFTISFLQAIYVQQDFIEEMLELFKTGQDKGVLKNDPLYYINRDVRNEIVGHPIRKFQGKLISSTLFSYDSDHNEIQYLRYHRDNNFKFELMSFKVAEIQNRHKLFLEKYFNVILFKLKSVVKAYLSELENLEIILSKRNFPNILKLTNVYFEDIFKSDFLYDQESLLTIYNRREEHFRYQNLINRFTQDLKESIAEKKIFATELFKKKPIKAVKSSSLPEIKIIFVKPDDEITSIAPTTATYHYEIGKLATKRDPRDFEFFGSALRSKCANNKIVIEEMDHMEKHLWDDIEYYSALRLICLELGEE